MVERLSDRVENERQRRFREIEESQLEAVWEGVRQSQESVRQSGRAVTVAWLAAIVGIVSAIVNIVVPYVTHHIESQDADERSFAAKAILLPEMDNIISAWNIEQMHAGGPSIAFKMKANVENEAAALQGQADRYDNVIKHQDALISQLPNDPAITRTLSVMDRAIAEMRDRALADRQKLLSKYVLPSNPSDAAMPPAVMSVKLLRYLNGNDNGQPRSGPIDYADCFGGDLPRQCVDIAAEDSRKFVNKRDSAPNGP